MQDGHSRIDGGNCCSERRDDLCRIAGGAQDHHPREAVLSLFAVEAGDLAEWHVDRPRRIRAWIAASERNHVHVAWCKGIGCDRNVPTLSKSGFVRDPSPSFALFVWSADPKSSRQKSS